MHLVKTRLFSRSIGLVILTTQLVCQAQKPSPILSVCDVERLGEKLIGKIVTVRGVLRDASPGSTDAFFDELVDQHCKEVEIHVASADSSFLANVPAGYKPDFASVRKAARIAEKAAVKGRSLSATVEGVLYRQEKAFDSSRTPRHKWYPFEIVVAAIRNFKEQ